MIFKRSWYDAETGRSTVKVEHLGKCFFGEAKLNPADRDRASEIIGCQYAEARAQIKALKYEMKLEKAKCEECRKFVKACEMCKDWDPDSKVAKVVYRQLSRRIKKVNALADEINSLYEYILKDIAKRDKFLKDIEEKKKSVKKD